MNDLKVKSVIFLFYIGILCCVSGCSEDRAINFQNPSQITETRSTENLVELQRFNNDLQCFTDSFISNTVPTAQTRGFGSSLEHTMESTVADAAGGLVGKYIGRYAGAAVGSTCANPFGIWAGSLIGSWIGKHMGAVLASAVLDYAINEHRYQSSIYTSYSVEYETEADNTNTSPSLYSDFSIKISSLSFREPLTGRLITTSDDSLGYYHNKHLNYSKQVMTNVLVQNDFNFDILFSTLKPLIEKDLKVTINIPVSSSDYMNLQYCMEKLYQFSKQCLENDMDITSLARGVSKMFSEFYPLNSTDFYICQEYIGTLAEKISLLDKQRLHQYSQELGLRIMNSNLSPEMKYEVGYASIILINSLLLCQEQE